MSNDRDFDLGSLTPDEAAERLRKLGVDVGGWKSSDGEEKEVGVLPTFEKQALLLKKMKSLIEKQIGDDQKEISSLIEKRNRLLHGGGT
jgi:hypothetical protein